MHQPGGALSRPASCLHFQRILSTMKKRSASADRICAVAVGHFSEHGYDGSSLSDIAELAGMRKASLYSHLKRKDDLFLAVFADALRKKHSFMQQCLDDKRAQKQLPQRAGAL